MLCVAFRDGFMLSVIVVFGLCSLEWRCTSFARDSFIFSFVVCSVFIRYVCFSHELLCVCADGPGVQRVIDTKRPGDAVGKKMPLSSLIRHDTGEYALILTTARTASVRAVKYADVFVLSKNDLV